MQKRTAKVLSVHAGRRTDMTKDSRAAIVAEFDGFVGDAHKSHTRKCWAGDKQAKGTLRRNERQWSAVSVEELQQISRDMNLTETLGADILGANLCIEGISNLSRLPKGTLLKFPSGAELVIVEYNPPCRDMGEKIAARYKTMSGSAITATAFSVAAKLSRGVVGVIDAVGEIRAGDAIEIIIYEHPAWLARDDGK